MRYKKTPHISAKGQNKLTEKLKYNVSSGEYCVIKYES